MAALAPDKTTRVGRVHIALSELEEALGKLEDDYVSLHERLDCALVSPKPQEQDKVAEEASGVALVDRIRALTKRVAKVDLCVMADTENLEL